MNMLFRRKVEKGDNGIVWQKGRRNVWDGSNWVTGKAADCGWKSDCCSPPRNKMKVSTAHFQECSGKIHAFLFHGLLRFSFVVQMPLGAVCLSSVNCFPSSSQEKKAPLIHTVSLLKFKPISEFREAWLQSFDGMAYCFAVFWVWQGDKIKLRYWNRNKQ